MECRIKLVWSENEKIWYSKSLNDNFTLMLESYSIDVLIERVMVAIPEALALAGFSDDIYLVLEMERNEKLKVFPLND